MSIILKIKSYHLNTIVQPGPIPFCLTKAEWWLPLTWMLAVLGELEEDCAGLPAERGGARDATLLFCVGHSQQCTQSRDAGDAGNSSSHLVPMMCDVKQLQWQRYVRLPHISDRTHVLLGSKQPQPRLGRGMIVPVSCFDVPLRGGSRLVLWPLTPLFASGSRHRTARFLLLTVSKSNVKNAQQPIQNTCQCKKLS